MPAPDVAPSLPPMPHDVAKEVGDCVPDDAASQAPLGKETLDPHMLSEEQLRALCPKSWTPNEGQVKWVQAYICAPPGTTMAEVSRNVNIAPQTVRNWLWLHVEMRVWLQAAMMASMNVGRIWQALEHRALSGSDRAAHMCMMRYDPAYAAVHRSGPPSRKKPSDKDLEQAAQAAQTVIDAKGKDAES